MSNSTIFNPFLTIDMKYFEHNIIDVMHTNSMAFAVADYELEVKNVSFHIIDVMHTNSMVLAVAASELEDKNV